MEILSVLEAMEDLIEKSKNLPMTGKCLVDKEEALELVKEIRLKLPDDIKQAKWIKDERQRILQDAQKEAGLMLKESEEKIALLIDEHEITKKAYEQAEEIISSANKSARDIKQGTMEYADSILNKVEEILQDTVSVIRTNRQEIK